ncbi:hypothetical protein MASR1M65_08050 [Saprospiraceae bacterium]
MLFIVNPRLLFSQCETPDPSDELFEYYISLLPLQTNYSKTRSSKEISHIPIHFTVIRKTNGDVGTYPTETQMDMSIDTLNKRFVPSGVNFYRVGKVHYIDWTALQDAPYISASKYEYLSTALNVIVSRN